MSSGLKKFMHKVGDKLDISKGHHDNTGGAAKVGLFIEMSDTVSRCC